MNIFKNINYIKTGKINFKNRIFLKLVFYFGISLFLFSVVTGSVFASMYVRNTVSLNKRNLEARAIKVSETISKLWYNEWKRNFEGHNNEKPHRRNMRMIEDIAMAKVWIIEKESGSIYRLVREQEGFHHSEMEMLPGNAGSASLEQVTADHSEVQYLVDEGQITQLEALTHPRRNVITRALGTGNYWEPDFWVFPAHEGDRVMLCSDGLSGELSHEYMAREIGRAHV